MDKVVSEFIDKIERDSLILIEASEECLDENCGDSISDSFRMEETDGGTNEFEGLATL